MFAHTLPLGGLRPTEALPPTLTPNAIFAMAPPAPRGLSFLGACLVYSVCGAGLMYAPAIQTSTRRLETQPVILIDHTTPDEVPVLTHQTPPTPQPGLIVKNAPVRPEGWTPPIDSNAVPTTPTTLPTHDSSRDTTRSATPEDTLRPTIPIPPGTTGNAPSKTTTVDFDFQQMRILHQVTPIYPPLARIAKVQGEVVLLMVIDPHGVPTEVKALSGPHPALEQEAMRVARLWRFEPANLNGQSVSAQFKLTIMFRLK